MTEEMKSPPASKQKLSPYSIILVGSIIVSCIAMNITTMSRQSGIFTSWTALSSPSSGAESIIDAHVNGVWVKSKEGKIYRLFVDPYAHKKDPLSLTWEPVLDSQKMPQLSSIKRSNDCETLQPEMFPLNPKGQLVECVYSSYSGFSGTSDADIRDEGYFALITSGEVFYWHHFHNTYMSKAYFIFSSFIFPVIVASIISLIRAIMRITSRS